MVLPDDEQEELPVGLGLVGMGEGHRPGALGGDVERPGGDLGRGIGRERAEADVARSRRTSLPYRRGERQDCPCSQRKLGSWTRALQAYGRATNSCER